MIYSAGLVALEYLRHYLDARMVLPMLGIAVIAVICSLGFIHLAARALSQRKGITDRKAFMREERLSLTERFYELIFSGTAIFLFVGIYFTIDFLGYGDQIGGFWERYSSFILLLFILASVIFNTVIDRIIIPLNHVKPGEIASIRLIGMLYMLIIFAYIKFIYQDDNYDAIIMYFLTLVIGRFVYFDATLQSFHEAVRDAAGNLPLLALALLCTGFLALFGFGSGYLLKSNGVVLSLFIAHLYLLLVIFVVHHTSNLIRWISRKADRSEKNRIKDLNVSEADVAEDEEQEETRFP